MDEFEIVSPGGPLARSFEELGEGMRRLRTAQGWSRRAVVGRLQRIAERDGALWTLSVSSLQRFERGRGQRPRLAHAAALDEAYAASHWIALSLAGLEGAGWRPWAQADWPRQVQRVAWPLAVHARVWVHVWPSARCVGVEHRFELTWLGCARRSVRVVLAAPGQYWVLDKPRVVGLPHAELIIEEPMHPFHVLAGLGAPARRDVPLVDIGSGRTPDP